APARSEVRSAPDPSALPQTRRLVRIEIGGQVIRRGERQSHLAENKLLCCVFRWNRRPFWPESYNSESHDDPDRNFNESMQSNDPRGICPRNQNNDRQGDTGISISGLLKPKAKRKKADEKDREHEGGKIRSEVI